MRNYQRDALTQALLDDVIELKAVETNIRMAKNALLNIVEDSPKTFEFLCDESPTIGVHPERSRRDLEMMIDDLERVACFLRGKEKEDNAIKIFEIKEPSIQIKSISWISRVENFFIDVVWLSMITSLLLACGSLGAYGLEQMKLSGLEVSKKVDFEEATGQLGGASITSFSIFFASAVCGAVAGSLKNQIEQKC